ncbi:MAG: hypothetical protein O3B47_00055 [bacterium]|nr:hypothetical protein [bacterium]
MSEDGNAHRYPDDDSGSDDYDDNAGDGEASDHQVKGLSLKLPDDKREQLSNKMFEYRNRLSTKYKNRPNDDRSVVIMATSILIIERLLRDGTVNSNQFQSELRETYPNYNAEYFASAWMVIKGYCEDSSSDTDKTEELRSLEILLPPDKRVVMQRKMNEYKTRLATKYAERPSNDPSVIEVQLRILILEKLFQQGRIYTWDLSRELEHTFKNYSPELFERACKVIEQYIKNGGKDLHGGTGLAE